MVLVLVVLAVLVVVAVAVAVAVVVVVVVVVAIAPPRTPSLAERGRRPQAARHAGRGASRGGGWSEGPGGGRELLKRTLNISLNLYKG